MKKILFITPFMPSNIGAGVNYTRQLLDELSINCKVDLIYYNTIEGEKYHNNNPNLTVIEVFHTSKLKKLISSFFIPVLFPLFTAKFSLTKLFKIRKHLRSQSYDFVYLDFSQMFLFGKFLKNCKKIYMAHDVIGQRYERKNKLVGKWAKLSEKWILSGPGQIFTFSNKDSNIIQKWYNKASIVTSFYFEENVIKAVPENVEDYFVFFAMWARSDNYDGIKWFISNILPFVRQKKFKIIGMGLPDDIQKELMNYQNIEYLGFVDNPYPIIANSKALISPLFQGAGVKVKVLDALATGTPVIGTEISFEGIDKEFVELINKAKTASDFIERINTIDIPFETRMKNKELFIKKNRNKEIIKFLLRSLENK